MKTFKDHTLLILEDEDLMKNIYIFGTIRQSIVMGEISNNSINENSKNRYKILISVTLKKGNVCPVELSVLHKCIDASL